MVERGVGGRWNVFIVTDLEVRDEEEFGDAAVDLQEVLPVQQIHFSVTHSQGHITHITVMVMPYT